MSQPLNYPLQQLMEIKEKRFDQAVRVLEQKKEILAKEEETLRKVEAERDQELRHKNEKLQQLRDQMDVGGKVDKILQMKAYLKVVEEKLSEKEKKVVSQKKVVDTAQLQVEAAAREMYQKKKDLEKLEIHRKEWEREAKYWVEQKEIIEHDDQGATAHLIRKNEMKKREPNEY